ncbi:GTP-binding protein [Coprinopsis cinerea okayama7|uniref:GTP-binding protein n=1 Tax=Coprinopsis cinerea (strain Okayama-7 / 130 / ATCC MYA-4618 / FGSC 9003) TaxID=240176 RepID=A8P7F0_COPC7|nr:GTP-binding protein [Coprinopsis cinerea okayama7\|eukprot:XP_001839346.2 GTP-binding protein [Coprinopsis cinerea okayama7\
MPRIRKKTSKRVSLKHRASIQKKVKETRRKRARDAKKNPQWKSKHPKDPGIPNEFPYKDEILAEVQAQRRAAAEEKERKKAEKAAARAEAKSARADEDVSMDEDEDELPAGKNKLDVGAEAIAGLAAQAVKGQLKEVEDEDIEVEESDGEEVPILINRDLPTFESVLEAADAIVEVVDARDPLETRSQFLEEYAAEKNKKLLLVLSKIDTCPRESVSGWLSHLRSQHEAAFPFRACSAFIPSNPAEAPSQPIPPKGKGKSTVPLSDALGVDSILACLGQWAQQKKDTKSDSEAPYTIAVAGITNVGKSSFINSLLKQSALPVYTQASASRGPTTTELPQEVTLESNGQSLRIIDTPGVSFIYETDDGLSGSLARGRDILLRSRGRIDRLKDPSPPLDHITPRCNHEDLMLLYNLPAFAKGDQTAFLSGVARAHQLVKKRGDLDLAGAARTVLRDWSTGKFARYALPPPPSASKDPAAASESGQDASTTEWLRKLYANDEGVLQTLAPRKELRKRVGLVRLSSGSVDARKIELSETWAALEESDSESEGEEDVDMSMEVDDDDEDESGEEDDEEEGFDEDEEESGEEEEEEEEEPVVSSKRKRKAGSKTSAPPAKKVAFAPTTTTRPSKSQPSSKEKTLTSVLKKSSVASTTTATKASSAAKPKGNKAEAHKKVANKAASAKLKDNQSGDSYDFSKFFK